MVGETAGDVVNERIAATTNGNASYEIVRIFDATSVYHAVNPHPANSVNAPTDNALLSMMRAQLFEDFVLR